MKPLPLSLLAGSLSLFTACEPQAGVRAMPPVDKAAPAKFETATFALG